jgi:hypothetical protein
MNDDYLGLITTPKYEVSILFVLYTHYFPRTVIYALQNDGTYALCNL